MAQEEEALPPLRHSKKAKWGIQSYQEIAYNHLLGAPEALRGSLEGLGSIKLNLSWLPYLRVSRLYMGIGLGTAIREVRFEEQVVLGRTEEGRLTYDIEELPSAVRAKSKLQLGYLRIPAEIGILWKSFNLAGFGFAEALLWAKHKRKFREGQVLTRIVSYGNRNFLTEPIQYGIGARIGYRGIGLFGTYNLSFLWKAPRGPSKVQLLQAGIYFFETIRGQERSRSHRASLIATSD